MRVIAAAVLAVVVAVPLAAAQANPTPRQMDLSREMLKLAGVDDLSRQMFDTVVEQTYERMMASASGDEDRAEIEQQAKRLKELMRQKLDLTDFLDGVVLVYAQSFTEDELEQYVAFYKSAAGQKLTKNQGALMREGARLGQEKLTPKLTAIFEEFEHEQELRKPWERTMRDIRTIATAVEAWATDNDEEKYPEASSMEALRKELEPTYIRTLPLKDVWGNGYSYAVSDDRLSYRIVSAGSDGVFEWDSRRAAPVAESTKVRLSDHSGDDIIYGDGTFIQIPRVAQPKEEPEDQ